MHTFNQRLEERGEAIARKTFRRAHRLWKLHSFFSSRPLTFAEYLVGRSRDRVCAVAGVRHVSTFTVQEQVDAAQPFLQRFVDMEIPTARLDVVTGATGLHMTPISRSWWRVSPVNANV